MSEGFISSMTTTGRDVTMLLPGWADKFAGALGINNAGVVVGYGTSGSETQGFVYTPGSPSGTINALPQPPFLTDFQAQGINSAGTIVGYGPTPSGPWAGSYSSVGGYTQISPPGLSNAQALAINLSGAIVGQGQSATGLMGFAYTGGVFTLFSLSGGTVHIGGINNNALVGWVTDALGNVVKGFVVHSDGSSEEIVPSIQSLSGTWTNVQVTGISESGIIVGYGSYDNHLTAFIGEPTVVPVPPALLLLSTGLAAVVGFRRFRRK
jgi:probable HAF family extracellular repeat protein